MSTAALPGSYSPDSFGNEDVSVSSGLAVRQTRKAQFVRRRGSLEQGRALETLGHAVEYLVDSGLFLRDERNQRDEHEAIQILMRMSRAVFAECPEVVPVRQRLSKWFKGVAVHATLRG